MTAATAPRTAPGRTRRTRPGDAAADAAMHRREGLVAEAMAACDKPPGGQRSDADLRCVRDRLHECCAFFRLWPPRLQRMLCTLAVARRLVQGEVLASQGERPTHLCFLMSGQAAVCVRQPGQAGRLRVMAQLGPGDTFGEAALLGAPRHPAFVRVESDRAAVLAVEAEALAGLLLGGALPAAGVPPAGLLLDGAAGGRGVARSRALRLDQAAGSGGSVDDSGTGDHGSTTKERPPAGRAAAHQWAL